MEIVHCMIKVLRFRAVGSNFGRLEMMSVSVSRSAPDMLSNLPLAKIVAVL